MNALPSIAQLITCCFAVVCCCAVAIADDTKTLPERFNEAYDSAMRAYSEDQFAESAQFSETAYELGQELYGNDSIDVVRLGYNHAKNLLLTKEYDQARAVIDPVVDSATRILRDNSIELAPMLLVQGHTAYRWDDSSIRRKAYKKAIKIAENHYAEKSAELGWFLASAGIDMITLAYDHQSGHRALKKGHKYLVKTLGIDHFRTGYASYHLGSYLLTRREYKKSRDYFLQALNAFESSEIPSNELELDTHAYLVQVFEELGERDSATPHCVAIGRLNQFDTEREHWVVFKVNPDYPRSALNERISGYTIIEYEVDTNGFVVNPRLVTNVGHPKFVDESLEALNKFRYAPRFIDGHPVMVYGVQNKFTFDILP